MTKEEMGFCENCPKRNTCKKICRELRNFLNRKGKDRLYSDRHIRRKEIPYDPNEIDNMLIKKVLKRRFGGKRNTKDNWE